MRYFSGFSLSGESALLGEIVGDVMESPYIVGGFSYGAIKALEYVLGSNRRIDRLILLSPSYFAGRPKSFVKAQNLYFRKDARAYIDKFLENAAYPCDKEILMPYLSAGTSEDLLELLTYEWPAEKLQKVTARGTRIEIYLGAKDRIIDAKEAHSFFRNFGESYLFKDYGHILRGGDKCG